MEVTHGSGVDEDRVSMKVALGHLRPDPWLGNQARRDSDGQFGTGRPALPGGCALDQRGGGWGRHGLCDGTRIPCMVVRVVWRKAAGWPLAPHRHRRRRGGLRLYTGSRAMLLVSNGEARQIRGVVSCGRRGVAFARSDLRRRGGGCDSLKVAESGGTWAGRSMQYRNSTVAARPARWWPPRRGAVCITAAFEVMIGC